MYKRQTTKLPGVMPTSVPSGTLMHLAVCLFFLGVAGSPSNTMSPRPRKTSIPSGTLVHLAVWSQRTLAENWGLCTFRGGELGPRLTQCRVGRGLPPYQVASSSMQPFGRNRHGPKIGGLCTLFGEGLGPDLTQSRLG